MNKTYQLKKKTRAQNLFGLSVAYVMKALGCALVVLFLTLIVLIYYSYVYNTVKVHYLESESPIFAFVIEFNVSKL
jgi:hypothetical protein